MPNLPSHIYFARLAAENFRHPAVESHMGCYLLGSTAPDVRSLTGEERKQYHFADLDFTSIGDGVRGLLKAYPDLSPSKINHEPTVAFVAGYITHLVLDESWITDMYRPYFGNAEVFQGSVTGKVMDRVLQLDLDRLSHNKIQTTMSLLDHHLSDDIKVPFITRKTLCNWRLFVTALIHRGFSWDRLYFMAQRISKGNDAHPAHTMVKEFLRDVPSGLEGLYKTIPESYKLAFVKTSVERMTRSAAAYLSNNLTQIADAHMIDHRSRRTVHRKANSKFSATRQIS